MGAIESSSSSWLENQAVFVRTPVVYQTTAPSWDFQHVFQLREGERKGELEIHVYVEGRGKTMQSTSTYIYIYIEVLHP